VRIIVTAETATPNLRRPLNYRRSAPQVRENGEHAPVVLGRFSDSEFCEGASDVRFNRLLAEPERLADAAVRAAFGDQGEDLTLAWGERLERIGLVASHERFFDDGSVDHTFARWDPSQRVEQRLDPPYPFLH
jgi:hypothetical protein